MIKAITSKDALWVTTAKYAQQCSWVAGKGLANEMTSNRLNGWQRVFVALIDDQVVGYCTLAKTDCIPDVPYTPYIGYVFVDEAQRGKRLSQQLINSALAYAKGLGFDKVYLVSDHINLYEKYGFVKVDEKPAPWNPNQLETIFMHLT